jgi:glycosyltransferase involved in cell wall biosynthesis
MKILIIGHACSPYAGSEPGLTWNWAWHLAAENDVWLIAHPHFRGPVEEYLARHPRTRLRVHWAALPASIDPWNPVKGERGLNLHYMMWLHAAHRLARRLVAEHGIDLAHHVSLGTVGAPPPFWRLPIPFFWGPLGGGQTAPTKFREYFGEDWERERRRVIRLDLTARLPGLARCCRAAACVFATNHETAALLVKAGAPDVRLLADNGLNAGDLAPLASGERGASHEPPTFLWAGRIEARKGLPLLIEAVAQAADMDFRVIVAGDGPQLEHCRELAERLGMSGRIEFAGRVPPQRMAELFRVADAFVFTALRDSLGSVTLEALARGVPLITLDHQGQGAIIPDNAAIKVPVDDPPATIRGLASAIRLLSWSPEERSRLSRTGLAFAHTLEWSNRVREMNEIYREKLGFVSAPAKPIPAKTREANAMNDQRPLISVVVINKNCARWLPMAIDSVLAQTWGPLELIVVDDDSTDASPDVVLDYARRDPRVSLVRTGTTLYTSGARNLGIESARGEFISFLDADDRMLPDALERQHAAFVKAQARNPDVQLLCFDAYIINEAGKRMSRYMPFEFWDVAIDHGTPGFTLPSTWFFRRELTARFVQEWQVAEAGPFLHQIVASGGFSYVGEVVAEYRVRMTSLTNNRARDMLKSMVATEQTIARGADWSAPVTPNDVPDPGWSAVAAWKYGRIAKAAAINQKPLTALRALAMASLAQPRVTLSKVWVELRRQLGTNARPTVTAP